MTKPYPFQHPPETYLSIYLNIYHITDIYIYINQFTYIYIQDTTYVYIHVNIYLYDPFPPNGHKKKLLPLKTCRIFQFEIFIP